MRELRWKTKSTLLLAAAMLTSCGDPHSSTGGPDADVDTSTEDTDPEGDTECEGIDFPVAGHPPNMFIVLDRSYSMGMEYTNAWNPCVEALVDITEKLDHQVRFGLLLFPNGEEPCTMSDDGPLVEITPINHGEIEQALVFNDPIGWGTPTAEALEQGYEYLAGIDVDGPRYVILATDGAPNCSSDASLTCETCTYTAAECETPLACLDDQQTYAKIAEYHDYWGIGTFVIGLAGMWDAWDEVLSTAAYLGGTGDYYEAQTDQGPGELEDALQEIAAQSTDCSFDVEWSSLGPITSTDPMLVNLLADGDILPYSEGCQNPDGWHWVDEDTLELCEGLCHDYKWGEISKIHASFGCETIIE